MNQSQIHLALTHLPVILTIIGMVIMIVSFLRKNQAAVHISLWMLIFAGLSAIPVFLSGEGAEEVIEYVPGVLESTIETHEHFAVVSVWIVMGTALLASLRLLVPGKPVVRFLNYSILLVALVSSGTMAYTAHLGGQIRHSEIRPGFVSGGVENSEMESHREADFND